MKDLVSSQSWVLKTVRNKIFFIQFEKTSKRNILGVFLARNGHIEKWPFVNKGPKVFRGIISYTPYPKPPIEWQEKKYIRKIIVSTIFMVYLSSHEKNITKSTLQTLRRAPTGLSGRITSKSSA
jgi:hypothetical protein